MSEERTPVSFSVAKPVNPKSRHPFSGVPLSPGEIDEAEQADAHIKRPGQLTADRQAADDRMAYEALRYTAIPATDSNPIRQAIAALRLQREKIDRAIETLEELA